MYTPPSCPQLESSTRCVNPPSSSSSGLRLRRETRCKTTRRIVSCLTHLTSILQDNQSFIARPQKTKKNATHLFSLLHCCVHPTGLPVTFSGRFLRTLGRNYLFLNYISQCYSPPPLASLPHLPVYSSTLFIIKGRNWSNGILRIFLCYYTVQILYLMRKPATSPRGTILNLDNFLLYSYQPSSLLDLDNARVVEIQILHI